MLLWIMRNFLNFLIYAFAGYIIEIIICSYEAKKLVNRGFLFGPICPIYGVGSMLIIFGLSRYSNDPIVVFVLGTIITAGVEYYTSYIFEKIFHNKWWDYSERPDNLNGRICLGNCLGFGIGSILIVYVFQPIFEYFLNGINDNIIMIVGSICMLLLIIDLIASTIIAYNLRSKLIVAEQLKKEKLEFLPNIIEKKYQDEISKIKFKTNRLIKNYPDLAKNLRKELSIVKEMMDKGNVNKNKKVSKK